MHASQETQRANLSTARAFLFASSSSRSLGGAFVSSDARRRAATKAISSTAESNGASFAFDGLVNPLIFLTNCRDASRISSSVTGGSKLNKFLIFLHIRNDLQAFAAFSLRRSCHGRRSRPHVSPRGSEPFILKSILLNQLLAPGSALWKCHLIKPRWRAPSISIRY
jgi:hypothetical protein